MERVKANSIDHVTEKVINRFNETFRLRDVSLLDNLIAEDCIMETAMPAPNGVKTVGREACLNFWKGLIEAKTDFAPEEITIMGEKAIIIWRLRWGTGDENSVKGCNLMTVKDGLITEAIGFLKGTLSN